MHRIILVLVGLALWPAAADAQRSHDRARTARAPALSMEPYTGAFFDPVVQEGRQSGVLVGLRVGYGVASRVNFLADVGYSEVNGAGAVSSDEEASTRFIYGNDWVFGLGGLEFVLLRGTTSGSISVMGGVGWRSNEIETRIVGDAAEPEIGGWGTFAIAAPGVTLAHRLGARSTVRVSFQDYILDFDEDPDHAPVLTVGLRFR